MSDVIVDSCVVAKWILPEPDSAKAVDLMTRTRASGSELIALDIAVPEVANAVWKKYRRGQMTRTEATRLLQSLGRISVTFEPAANLVEEALEIAMAYDRSVYDALFIAMARKTGLQAVTSDEPLYNATHRDFPQVVLLRQLR